MAADALAFLRGSAHLFYEDMARQGVLGRSSCAGAVTWTQGDSHLLNFGSLDDDKGNVVYDLNDFDEAFVSDGMVDVLRHVTSIAVLGSVNKLSATDRADGVSAFAAGYKAQLEAFRGNSNEKSFQLTASNAYGQIDDFLVSTASADSRAAMLKKWTSSSNGVRTFDLSYVKLAAVSSAERTAVAAAIAAYRSTVTSLLGSSASYFAVKDVARRLDAGIGSLGVVRYYVLIEGGSSSTSDDRILDVKQQRSAPSQTGLLTAAQIAATMNNSLVGNHQGARVSLANKAMLGNADDHLGYATISGSQYSVRELSPYKESIDTTLISSHDRMTKFAEQHGMVLAAAHARGDADFSAAFPAAADYETSFKALPGYAGFSAEVLLFAQQYASQVKTDYALFITLVKANKLGTSGIALPAEAPELTVDAPGDEAPGEVAPIVIGASVSAALLVLGTLAVLHRRRARQQRKQAVVEIALPAL